jgi:hypothetical protein
MPHHCINKESTWLGLVRGAQARSHMQDAAHLLNNHLGVSKHMLWCPLSINRDAAAVCPGLESKTANDERLFYICLLNRRAKSGPLCVRRVVCVCVCCLHLHKSWYRDAEIIYGVSTFYASTYIRTLLQGGFLSCTALFIDHSWRNPLLNLFLGFKIHPQSLKGSYMAAGNRATFYFSQRKSLFCVQRSVKE